MRSPSEESPAPEAAEKASSNIVEFRPGRTGQVDRHGQTVDASVVGIDVAPQCAAVGQAIDERDRSHEVIPRYCTSLPAESGVRAM